jgi:hypothetical protein
MGYDQLVTRHCSLLTSHMNDTLIFLVLAGLALVFKWLTSRTSSDSENSEPPSPNEQEPRRAPPQSEEERVRRFLEALGAPPGTQPPPPVRPRRVVTPAPRGVKPKVKRSWVQPLPPLVTTPDEVAPPPVTIYPLPEPVVAKAEPAPEVFLPPPLPPLSAPLLRKGTPPGRASATSVMSLGARLRSRGSIREAIVLREVLGPPPGLQGFDDLRSF